MKRTLIFCFFITGLCLASCQNGQEQSFKSYFASADSGVQAGGVKMVEITTPKGKFKVWTKRIGNNPKIKVLLLHGGPGMTHEYMECFESFFPQEGIEFIEYDQLGSYYSDQPKDSTLWTMPRFVDEVEQVRKALKLDKDNFYLLGVSWGGSLAMEYALKYQQNLKGLIVSNMVSSCPEYGKYANEVLAKQMNPEVLAEIKALEATHDFANPRYMELLRPNFYKVHLCRLAEYPEALKRTSKHANNDIYVRMQGPSEFGISGTWADWDITNRLHEISVPTLMVGAKYDTMDPKAMEKQSKLVKNGAYLYCPNGSHLAMWDDQQIYMNGVINFIKKVDQGTFHLQK